MATWRAIPSAARGALIFTVGVLLGAAGAILLTASGLVDSQIPSIAAPSTVTVTATPGPGFEPVPPAPKDRFGDSSGGGGFAVGRDVLAGRYTSKAPRDGESCTWQRLRGEPGSLVRVADGRKVSGPSTMTVKIGDVVVTSGCEEWVRQP